MARPSTDATIVLWGREIAAVSWLADAGYAVFQYDPDFAESERELSPLVMPLGPDPYSFASLPKNTFKGLPGMLADALPDKYGDRLINTWLAEQRNVSTIVRQPDGEIKLSYLTCCLVG